MDIKQLVASVIETIIKIVVAVFVVKFVFGTAVKAYDYGYRVFAEEPMTVGEGRTISISVGPDDSVKDIGENLVEKGLIRDANLFFVQELLSEYHGKIQPGIYDLNTSMKSDEMMEIMSAEYVEEDEEEGVSSDNVPIGSVDSADTENPNGADDVEGAENPEGADDIDGLGNSDNADGAVEPDGAGE